MRENIVVGDLHGCRAEFNLLLQKIGYNKSRHRVVLVGDIIDRGEDPVGLVHQIQDMGLESVLGNHEEKLLRWRQHEDQKQITAQPNPMKPPVESRKKEWLAFSREDLEWFRKLPLKIHLRDNWHVVHAGMEPCVSFEHQDLHRIIRIRYVDDHGRYIKTKDRERPPSAHYWTDKWAQPYNIIFGHQKHARPTSYWHETNTCVALDTGCVFGGALTAYNLEANQFTQIEAKRKYY